MFTEQMQQDVIMVLKFPSNSPVTHIAANTQPGLASPAIITVTANRIFAVNKWHGLTGERFVYMRLMEWTYASVALQQINLKGVSGRSERSLAPTESVSHFLGSSLASAIFLIDASQELTRLVSIGCSLIWESVDCVYWIAVSNVTHAAASIRSHVHLHTSASHFAKPDLRNVRPLKETLHLISVKLWGWRLIGFP